MRAFSCVSNGTLRTYDISSTFYSGSSLGWHLALSLAKNKIFVGNATEVCVARRHDSIYRGNKRPRGRQALTPHLQRPALSEAMGPSHFFLRNLQNSQLFRSGCAIIVEGIVAVDPARSDGIGTISWRGCWPMFTSWGT